MHINTIHFINKNHFALALSITQRQQRTLVKQCTSSGSVDVALLYKKDSIVINSSILLLECTIDHVILSKSTIYCVYVYRFCINFVALKLIVTLSHYF